MRLKELTKVIVDKVVIYKTRVEIGEYIEIFKGDESEIPQNVLEMEVGFISAKREGVLDIEVRNDTYSMKFYTPEEGFTTICFPEIEYLSESVYEVKFYRGNGK